MRPQFNAHLVSTDADGNVVAVEDMSRSDVRINGGFFVFRREIVDLIEPGDELVEETFARLIARRELVAYPYDGFFGADGHDQGPAAAREPARVGPGAVAAAPARRASPSDPYARAVLSLLGRRAAPPRPRDRLPRRRHRDRVRRDAPHARAREPGARGRLGRARGAGRTARDEARASAEAFLAGVATSRVEVLGFRDGFLPYVGGEVKDVFEELKGARRSAARAHARRLRLPPGPPARVRADMEHVPEPPDPRVRDPEGRRRPRPAERVRPALRGASWRRSSTLLERHFPSQAGKHWFDRETFLGLMRLRGMEAAAPERFAEAFTARKVTLSP